MRARRIGVVALQQGPDRSRLIWVTRAVLGVQVVATAVAIVLAAPDFIDRLQRPSSCLPGCVDVRGVVFIVLLIFLTPAAALLTAAVLLLRGGRLWPALMVLVVNLLVVGFIASVALQLVNGATECSDMCDSLDFGHVPLLVQKLQVLLLGVPPIASLVFTVLLVSWLLIRPTRTKPAAARTHQPRPSFDVRDIRTR